MAGAGGWYAAPHACASREIPGLPSNRADPLRADPGPELRPRRTGPNPREQDSKLVEADSGRRELLL